MNRLNSLSELEDAIEDLLKGLCEETGADTITFHYYDEPHNRLVLPVGVNLLQPRRFRSWLPNMDRVAGRIVETGEPIIAEDAEHHPDTAGPFVYAENIKSAAGYLLHGVSHQKLGVLFFNYREPHTFSQTENDYLEKLSGRTANIISRWVVENPDLELQLSALPGRRREGAALQKIADRVREKLGNVAVAIWVLDQKEGVLKITAQSGLDERTSREARLRIEELSSMTKAFRNKKLQKGNVFEEASFSEEQARKMRLNTVWAFPILSQSRALGVLSVYPINYEDITSIEKMLVEVFADQVAATIESQRSILTLTTLHDMGRRLTSTLENPQQLMKDIVTRASRVTKADSVVIHQYDSTNDEFNRFSESVIYGIEPYTPTDRPRDEGVSRHIVEHGLLIITDIDEADPELVRTTKVLRAGVRAYLGIRLKAGESIVGVLFLNYNEKREFSPDDITIATAFADYAATAIHNSRLYRESLQRAERLDLVRQVAAAVGSAVELDEILQLAVNGLARVFEVKQSAITLLDETGSYFDVQAEYLEPDCVSAIGHRIPVQDNPQVEKILKTKQPLIVEDVQHDPIMLQVKDIMAERKTISMMIVPIVIDDEVAGTIGIDAVEDKRDFTDEEAELAKAIADQAAAAIRNARLFQQRDALQKIARDITSELKRDTLLEKALNRALKLLNCEYGSISVFDPEANLLRFQYARGKSKDMSVVLGQGLIGTAAQTRKTIKVADVSEDNRYIQHIGETKSELDVPMLVGERLVGVLNAESKQINAFSEEDQRLAEALAAQVAVAFHTAELYEKRADDVRAIQEIFSAIGSVPVNQMLEKVVTYAARLSPASYATIWLLDEQEKSLRFGAEYGREVSAERKKHRLPINEDSINGYVALTRTTYLCNNVDGDPYYSKWYSDVRSELATPLIYQDRLLGTLNLESEKAAAFTDDHIRLVEALAGAAAVAIQNARLYSRLDALVEVSQTVTSILDLSAILDHILKKSLEILRANHGTLRLLNRATAELELRAHRGEIGDLTRQPLQVGQGIVGWVAEHGKPQLVSDVSNDDRYIQSLKGTCSEVAVPITSEGQANGGNRTIGVLNIEHPQSYAFDEHDMHLLEAIANQAAIAIRNARSYESMQAVNDVGQTLTSGIRLQQDEILELIYEQAQKLTGAQDMYIALYNDETNIIRFGLATEHGKRVEYKSREANMEKRGKTEEVIFTKQPILHGTLEESRAWYGRPGHQEFIGRVSPSWLGVPMIASAKVLGMIALYNWEHENVYDEQDLQTFSSMASQAAIALDNADLFYNVNQKLESLLEFGQALTGDIRLTEQEILELIHTQASHLMDTDNMYIALYNERNKFVRFGLAYVRGERVDVKSEEGWQPRKDGKGRTEWIIDNRQPIFQPTRQEGESWYADPDREEYIGDFLASWIGVPMISGDKVLGVIATYHPELEYVYDGDDLEVLQAMAGQAATALENARLYEEAREEVIAFKKLSTLGTATAALQHRINNTFNIIVPNVTRLRNRVDMSDETTVEILDIIERNARYTSDVIRRIQEPLRGSVMQTVKINALLDEITSLVRERWSEVIIEKHLDDEIPTIQAPSGQVTEVFRNLLENACHAMHGNGKLTVASDLKGDIINVRVQDTGSGISPQIQERLFKQPVPSKDPGGGAGLGLWLSQLILQTIGGRLQIEKTDSTGTTMLIQIPASIKGGTRL